MGDKDENSHGGRSSFSAVVAIVILFSLVFINSPGVLFLALIVEICNITLDIGQFWTFSIIISSFIYIILKLMVNNHINWYIKLCLVVSIFYMVAYFGFHQGFAL